MNVFSAAALFLACSTSLVTAEMFYLNNLFHDGHVPYFQNELGHRFMQLETGNRADINQTANTCSVTAFELTCNVASVVTATDETASNMDMTVICELDSQVQADFRYAKNCRCGIAVTDSDGNPKTCGCVVCPAGFGPSPVSIECEDDFVIGECSSLDCDFACNGTCSFDCANSGPDCKFCEDDVFAPTRAPTGDGGDSGRSPSLIPSGAVDSSSLLFQAVLGALAAMTLYVAV